MKQTPRLFVGLAVGLAGVGVMASVLLPQSKTLNAVKGASGAAGGTAKVPELKTTGEVMAVGYASGIPAVTAYDTGPIDTRYMPQNGWAYSPIGGKP